MKEILDIRPSPRLLQVLGDIPLQNWQCLAELVDNSLDELLKQPQRTTGDPLLVDITVEVDASNRAVIVVRDNGSGMTAEELERALRAGHSSKGRYGTLGLFGMGFNIATARLGEVTTVETTTAGSDVRLSTTIDFAVLQREESFAVPLLRNSCDPSESGTTVRIQLKRAIAEELMRPSAQQIIARQLGDVYSFLLRDSVPGIVRAGLSSKVPARITFNGRPVDAVLPCIWADHRSVVSGGAAVSAVQYVDEPLTVATACLDCGYWDRKNGPEVCEECGSANLQERSRRIWGWIGVQRYIDSKHYGIDFLRYGRKILSLDKSIFTYQDPDTLVSDVEYPIEMPANQGRIVGEIHLDHVPVTYQKNDFNRQSRDWQTAIVKLRGEGPLKPRGAKNANNSPLARLYSAFRRNDPGLRYLTAGDGKSAIHTTAREWAAQYHKGVARFLEDTEWFEAAERHQNAKDGHENAQSVEASSDAPASSGESTSGSAIDRLIGPLRPRPVETPRPESRSVLSEAELLTQARLLGTKRNDLSGKVNLSLGLGSWQLSVVTTKARLEDGGGSGASPVRHGIVSGTELEVLVHEEHAVFKEYGRDVRDVALMRIAEMIKGLSNSSLSVATIYGELVQAIPDLRTTEHAILERITRVFERVRDLMMPHVVVAPDQYWSYLDAIHKAEIEKVAAVRFPDADLDEVIESSRYVPLVPPAGLRALVERASESFFDGKVFKPRLSGRSADAQGRVIGNILRDFDGLIDFQTDSLLRQKHDVALALITLDHLETQIISEDA